MIEKISLPIDLCDSFRDPFEIADEIRKLSVARNTNQHMQVIGHQQK